MSTKLQTWMLGGLAAVAMLAGNGCVADRPSRNGVFDENQYLRKDFLIRPDDSKSPDSGWIVGTTITEASEPNVFGDADVFGLFAGATGNEDNLVHFVVTQDKLQLVSNKEIAQVGSTGVQPQVINAWPVTNVDLKYRVNLDGEKTNFYEENQELDWQVRQWVKVNFDKNDLSDLQPLGSYYTSNIDNCTDTINVSATLVPNSFLVDVEHDYFEFSVQVTLPITFASTQSNPNTCTEAYGALGVEAARLGRTNETVTLKYSFMRANAQPTYPKLPVAEKDPIQRKYGPLMFYTIARDADTGLLAANQYVERFDPTKEIKWYFEETFPKEYMPYFTANPAELPQGVSALPGVTTIEDATNQLLQDAGAMAHVSFHPFDDPLPDHTPIQRHFGDVRFSMLRWVQSLDQQSTFAGVTSNVTDPRSGETLASNIVFENFAIKDYYATRLDAYLQTIGASAGSPFDTSTQWPDTPMGPDPNDPTQMTAVKCDASTLGSSIPIVSQFAIATHSGGSTLFQKLQQYLYRPASQYGPLGPQDFISPHTDDNGDFFNAYYALLPYIIYADPATNPFVIPEPGDANNGPAASASIWNMFAKEAQLHQLEGQLDQGHPPFDINSATGSKDARAFLDTYRDLTLNHRALKYARAEIPVLPGLGRPHFHADNITDFSLEDVIGKDGRHCVNTCVAGDTNCAPGTFHWESKSEWVANLISSYWAQVFWHEFGHAMGLSHNFMASVDKPNFPEPIGMNSDKTTHYPLYSSSVMEYNATPDRVFWGKDGWGPYDKGAIAWIYANNNGNPANVPQKPMGNATATGSSGQISASYPWIDPDGFCKDGEKTCTPGQERQFLFCDERHTKFTPLCRAGDIGSTPSEITANEIDNYEWQYKWRNFRQYHKFWDDSAYGDQPMNFIGELRRFISLWAFDMSGAELTTRFQQLGIKPPMNAPSSQFYYNQLTDKFTNEMSSAAALTAAFHEAIIQQSAGQRPYVTQFDNYFGDVTLQGITLDKLDALQAFVGLWPIDDYDPTQSAGGYIASYSPFGLSDEINGTAIGSLYQTVAEQATQSMIGGSYAAFPYFKPLGVAQFTVDTHSVEYINAIVGAARQEVQDWTGGWQFYRLTDFLAFFGQLAVDNNFKVFIPNDVDVDCTVAPYNTPTTCPYDPRTPRAFPQDTFFSDQYNQFTAPDGRRYIWIYLRDRNEWFVCDRDRNSATYQVMYNYNTDVIFQKDDGNYGGAAYSDELQVKYFLDYFSQSSTYTP
jgi:hypothetical protein